MGSHSSTKSRPAKPSTVGGFVRGLGILAAVAIVIAITVVKLAN